MPRTKLRTGLLALLTALCAGLAGCAGPRINFWPIYFCETREAPEAPYKRRTYVEILHPFFATENDDVRHYHVVRPLYNYESDKAEQSHRLQYLWPLGLQSGKKGEKSMHRLFPFFQHSTATKRATGDQVSRGLVFPIIYWGHHPVDGASFAVFPLGGVTHQLLGNTFSFVLFPLYSYYRQGDYKRHNFIWPFFSVARSSDGQRNLLRIWPFYVHNQHTGSYDHHYLVWPFVRWGSQQWTQRRSDYVRRYFAFHPLFASSVTRDGQGAPIAYQRQILFFTRLADTREREQRKGWSFLFSLIRSESSPTKYDFRIFPFYWHTIRHHRGLGDPELRRARYRVLWPLIWVDKNNQGVDEEDSNLLIVPFYWQYGRRYKRGEYAGKTKRSITLWPLVTRQREPDGSSHFWIASHGWKDASEGYKRNYRAFFDFFQYHLQADGEREVRILSRLYHHKFGPNGTYLSVPLLFDYDSIGDVGADGKKSWSCLLGLVKCYWSDKGRRWRLFYMPF